MILFQFGLCVEFFVVRQIIYKIIDTAHCFCYDATEQSFAVLQRFALVLGYYGRSDWHERKEDNDETDRSKPTTAHRNVRGERIVRFSGSERITGISGRKTSVILILHPVCVFEDRLGSPASLA